MDYSRVMILRTASDFDRAPPGPSSAPLPRPFVKPRPEPHRSPSQQATSPHTTLLQPRKAASLPRSQTSSSQASPSSTSPSPSRPTLPFSPDADHRFVSPLSIIKYWDSIYKAGVEPQSGAKGRYVNAVCERGSFCSVTDSVLSPGRKAFTATTSARSVPEEHWLEQPRLSSRSFFSANCIPLSAGAENPRSDARCSCLLKFHLLSVICS
jgi:hypothetical protein